MRKSQFLRENEEVITKISQENDDFGALVNEFKRVSASINNCSIYTNNAELKKRKCFLKDKIQSAISRYMQKEQKTTTCKNVA